MQVRIYKPIKSPMQSGANINSWLMEFIRGPKSRFTESVMARTASSDMANEIKLYFPSKESAIEFAKNNSYSYELIKNEEPIMVVKTYAANFK